MIPSDQKDRGQARLGLDANIVVEAGAGTGKTTLLVDRILFLILGKRGGKSLPITSIVALTFTDKAAGEIKLRLANRLVDLIGALSGEKASAQAQGFLEELRRVFKDRDEETLARARRALEHLDRAPIGTIHSFAAQLLKLYPIEAGIDPGFVVDEGAAFDELFANEWALWLDEELGEKASRAQAWRSVLRLAALDDLEDLARALCGEGVEAERAGRPDALAADWLERLASEAESAARGQKSPGGNSRILESIKEICARLRAMAAAVRSDELPAPAALEARELKDSAWPKKWDPEGEAAYQRAFRIAKASSAEGEALLRQACGLLRPFIGGFRMTYARRGYISFDGLLRRARDLVRDHLEVRDRLKKEFEALLIDEFQDTDPLQGELLIYLAENEGGRAGRWEDVRLGPGRLFVVGDPKQSIYRFRGADMAAYQGFTAKILSGPGALRCDLTTNFRSPEELISPINAIFDPLMKRQPGLQAEYKALQSAGKGDGGPAVDLVTFAAESGEVKISAADRRALEAAWIGDWIQDNCGPGKGRRFKDIAVLLRTSGPLAAILDAFKARGIPYAVEMERFFYGAQEIIDFLNLLKVLDDPQDALSLAALLRSPLVVLEDASLYALAREGGLDYMSPRLDGLKASSRQGLDEFYAVLRGLRARVGRRPLGELVRAVLEETSLLEVAARAYHGQQTAANLSKLARMAEVSADEKGMTLGEFIRRVSADAAEGSSGEGENPLADEHLEAVRVMTVHKSKGLEFPVVFLANASGKRGSSQSPVLLRNWSSGLLGLRLARCGAANASMSRLMLEEDERQEHETLRLLYVALTRARERLFVLGGRKGDKSSLTHRLTMAGAWLSDGREPGLIRLPGADVPMRAVLVGAAARPSPSRELDPRDGQAVVPASRMKTLWDERRSRYETGLASAWVRRPTDGIEPSKESVWDEETRPPAPGLGPLVGRLCHGVLEGWDFAGGGDVPRALRRVLPALTRLDPAADWPAAAAEAEVILRGFVSSPAARMLASAEILGREVPFVYAQDGAVMRGAIDLLYRQGGRLVIADYKTEAAAERDLPKLRAKYAAQGRAYIEAVKRALKEEAEFRLIFLRAPELS